MNKAPTLNFSLFRTILVIFLLLAFVPQIHSNTTHKTPQPDKIKLQLKYYHQFQFAGYYAALHKGYFSEEGLDVELLEGGNINSIQMVLEGKADYGIAANDILIERVNNKPIVLLASIFQSSPSIFLSLKESNIHTAHDLINKRIMLLDQFRDPELLAIFYQEGIQLFNIQRQTTSYNINDLINKKTDALNAYSTNEPYFLEEQNIPYSIIYPQSYGIDFYGDGIFTSEKEIENNPKRVDAFIRASKKGWEYALANSEEIIDLLITKYGVKKSKNHLRFEANQIKKLILNEYVEIGHINPGRLDNIAKICAQMGMIKPNYNLDGFVYQPEQFKTPFWLKWTLIIITLICSIVIIFSLYLFIFNRQLRVAVMKQTSSLSIKNKELENEISERIKTEEALKISEKRFRELIENLPSGAIIIEGDKLFTNKKAYEITEYLNEETPDIESWFAALYKNKKNVNFQTYLKSKTESFKLPTVKSITTKSGLKKHVEFHAYSFDNKEIWLMNDISQRIATEKALITSEYKLRTYIDESPNGLVIFNRETKVSFSNISFTKLLELESDSDKVYYISDFFAPIEMEKNKDMLKQLLTTGKVQGEVIIQTANKTTLPVFINAVQLNSNEYLAFVMDTSQIKKVENELKLALKKAEESDRLKSAFLANMSHEIRTPMNGILGFSQLLLKNNLTKEKKEKYVDILNQNGRQLLDIINNIIDISYLEVQQLKIFSSAFSISKLFNDIEILFKLEKLKYQKEHLNISFINNVPEEYDQINSDSGKIKQVLINLVNNALKFTADGFIKITVDLFESKLVFKVEDSGIGIPKHKENIIFERFGQIENVYTKQFGGAGLGLPISKGLIELLDGEISLSSTVDKGSKFEFFIPITKINVKAQNVELRTEIFNWTGKKILIVEDVDINISYFTELFENTQAELLICKNGKEAIDLCESGLEPDLILMDIQMPEVNGIEATKAIRQILTNTPIIAQTAYASISDKENAILAGCNDFFAKPLNSEKLLMRINQFLETST